jgi:hypothetical protein
MFTTHILGPSWIFEERGRPQSTNATTSEIPADLVTLNAKMSLSLQNCVHSLRDTLGRLDDSIKTLDAGVSDLPRLSKVLQTTRVSETVMGHLKQTR